MYKQPWQQSTIEAVLRVSEWGCRANTKLKETIQRRTNKGFIMYTNC
ncbi:hypothetical protein SLEP1_g48241 [Rubroshorea leprosula]|uniref:Uncharacterized protein n=1 Tax=Rubroshorea leprosula TaxID=152421 RepID=A0AAV5LTZ2_9ROSI|nr:hypothetical protein SLEP1_g48241 [Rubroshorea leprosula]